MKNSTRSTLLMILLGVLVACLGMFIAPGMGDFIFGVNYAYGGWGMYLSFLMVVCTGFLARKK